MVKKSTKTQTKKTLKSSAKKAGPKAGGMEALREQLRKKQEELKRGGNKLPYYIFKEGTHRIRLVNLGVGATWYVEAKQIYFNKKLGGIISPTTIGEPCYATETFDTLNESKDEADKELAKQLYPRSKYLVYGIVYDDTKGKIIKDGNPQWILLPKGVFDELITLFLDPDEWGDFTDPNKGYDVKIIRTGKGQMDTEYAVNPCPPTKLPKQYHGPYDIEDEISALIPSYDETEEKTNEFLKTGPSNDDDEDEDAPKKKAKKGKKKKRDI